MQSDVIIETRNLTKVYRDFWGRQKVQALKALDLEIRRGEIFGLLGPKRLREDDDDETPVGTSVSDEWEGVAVRS